jgi:hypothetical protein
MSQQPPEEYGGTGQAYGTSGGWYGTGREQYGGPLGQQGGQVGQQGTSGGGQAMDLKLEEGLSEEMRVALHDLVQSVTACEWCAERCVDEGPGMSECLRRCRDVADLAALNVQFLARDSIFGPEAVEVFASAAEACARECARHGHRHCQECAEVLNRAVQSTRKMLASFERGAGQLQGAGGQQGGGFQGSQQPWGQQNQPQGQTFGQPQGQGYSEAPGQQTQLPVEGGGGVGGQAGPEYGQPQGQEYGRQGQGYGESQQYGRGQQY